MSQKGKVLIAAPVHPVLTEGLEREGYQLVQAVDIRQQEGSALIKDCVGVITSTRLQLNKELIDVASSLRWIGRMGSGMEVIDLPYARSKGILCLASPEGNCNAVGEHALGLLLGITRKIHSSATEVEDGKWLREENRGIELEGKTIVIIGFGHTGRAFAQKLRGMDMRILVYDKRPVHDAPDYVTVGESLEELLSEADIVSFHVPIAQDTYHYFDEVFLGKCQKPVILINTSRGNVVDTKVLPLALRHSRVTGAGLDVWEQEPLEKMDREFRSLLTEISAHPGVIITPHIAGYTHEALYKMSKVLLTKILNMIDK